MADYQFSGLSPHDFELLARDLLQAELGVRLEAFASGPDRGIDLRYAKGPRKLIVQCKHYPHRNWASLKRALAAEVTKVRLLTPSRYIVVTSMAMTPARKSEIQGLFKPLTVECGDIIGREDLNNLLARHPAVEQQNHKLWLTSVPVLSRVLSAQIFSEQHAELAAVQRRASRYVRNPSLGRALEALDAHHFVLITGVPGIGKSTLAEMILIEHLARGYEPFRVWEGVAEARSVWQRGERQLFYFDDFLGRTGLRHAVVRNEDERLLRFINEVRRTPNARLVLTTREYILHQAQAFMEGLAVEELELGQCVIDLGDYTPQIRAHILYNHLYFSDLPDEHLSELVRQRTYRTIVRHRNYSPRILEAMTDALQVRSLPAKQYPKRFVEALTNPKRLWEKAYKEHLSAEAQDFALVLTTLPDRVRLSDAEHAFEACHRHRGEKHGYPRRPYDAERALKELDGSFVKTQLSEGLMMVEFHNPSIRDFLEAHLRTHDADVRDLLTASLFAQQVKRIWEVLTRSKGSVVGTDLIEGLASRYWALRETSSIHMTLVHYRAGGTQWRVESETLLKRLAVLWDIVDTGVDLSLLECACDEVLDTVVLEEGDREDLVAILRRHVAAGEAAHGTANALFKEGLRAAFTFEGHLEVREWAALADFAEEFPDLVTAGDRDALEDAFGAAAEDEEQFIREEPDVDAQLGWFDELEGVASRLNVTLGLTREELERDATGWGDDDDDGRSWSRPSQTDDGLMTDVSLDSFFASLAEPRA